MTIHQKAIADVLKGFPDISSQGAARVARKFHPTLFRSVEHARDCVRYLRGSNGHKSRTNKAAQFIKPPAEAGAGTFAALPDGITQIEDWRAVQIDGPLRCLIISDVHAPYHDKAALLTALEYGRKHDADAVLLNGDIADCFSVSNWEKDPRQRRFPDEVKTVKELIGVIQKGFPKARMWYKLGNHEERLERYMQVRAPELLGLPGFDFASVFGLDAIELIQDRRPIRLGKLNVIHGHEFSFAISNPVNAARGYFLRAKTHILAGHLHQVSQHSETNLEGKVVSAWSTGALCDLHPKYAPINKWSHGFAFVVVDKNGVFEVQNLKVINGKCY